MIMNGIDLKNRKLIVSCSNNLQYSGLMTLDFAISHTNMLVPDVQITVAIMEENGVDGSIIRIATRENGVWKLENCL